MVDYYEIRVNGKVVDCVSADFNDENSDIYTSSGETPFVVKDAGGSPRRAAALLNELSKSIGSELWGENDEVELVKIDFSIFGKEGYFVPGWQLVAIESALNAVKNLRDYLVHEKLSTAAGMAGAAVGELKSLAEAARRNPIGSRPRGDDGSPIDVRTLPQGAMDSCHHLVEQAAWHFLSSANGDPKSKCAELSARCYELLPTLRGLV